MEANAVPRQTDAKQDDTKSCSKTVTDTIVGEHEHTIVGYSLVKGIGDGEPIASERFVVGGHEWVLLFYPDGKRSASSDQQLAAPPAPHPQQLPGMPPNPAPIAAAPAVGAPPPQAHGPNVPPRGNAPGEPPAAGNPARDPRAAGPAALMPVPGPPLPFAAGGAVPGAAHPAGQGLAQMGMPIAPAAAHLVAQAHRRDPNPASNEYAALFVALIGEGDNPQGVVNTTEGRVVRAFHKFTLVDQTGQDRDLTKGRRREQGAVKISCARQDPNARNCHGYRKFVKRSVLEDPSKGYLLNDTIVIRYTIELVVSSGGALSRSNHPANTKPALPLIPVPASTLGKDLVKLLESGQNCDVSFHVDGEVLQAHKMLLQARSPVFHALLSAPMKEGQEGVVVIEDVIPPVFKALLHFVYSDSLPEDMDRDGKEGASLEVTMAQHLLVAADRFQLPRLRGICERRLVETVEVDTVATTLALAEQNHAVELKRACLEFVSKNLGTVMSSEGYQYMVQACPQLQEELLGVIAAHGQKQDGAKRSRHHSRHLLDDGSAAEDLRRVRIKRE